jgi:hypothetical protein
MSLDRLGDAYRAAGAEEFAHSAWSRALAIFEELGRADADRLRTKVAVAA